jgi:hypothetical protein
MSLTSQELYLEPVSLWGEPQQQLKMPKRNCKHTSFVLRTLSICVNLFTLARFPIPVQCPMGQDLSRKGVTSQAPPLGFLGPQYIYLFSSQTSSSPRSQTTNSLSRHRCSGSHQSRYPGSGTDLDRVIVVAGPRGRLHILGVADSDPLSAPALGQCVVHCVYRTIAAVRRFRIHVVGRCQTDVGLFLGYFARSLAARQLEQLPGRPKMRPPRRGLRSEKSSIRRERCTSSPRPPPDGNRMLPRRRGGLRRSGSWGSRTCGGGYRSAVSGLALVGIRRSAPPGRGLGPRPWESGRLV